MHLVVDELLTSSFRHSQKKFIAKFRWRMSLSWERAIRLIVELNNSVFSWTFSGYDTAIISFQYNHLLYRVKRNVSLTFSIAKYIWNEERSMSISCQTPNRGWCSVFFVSILFTLKMRKYRVNTFCLKSRNCFEPHLYGFCLYVIGIGHHQQMCACVCVFVKTKPNKGKWIPYKEKCGSQTRILYLSQFINH